MDWTPKDMDWRDWFSSFETITEKLNIGFPSNRGKHFPKNYSPNIILKGTVSVISSGPPFKMTMPDLQEILWNIMIEKKCVIVFDVFTK